MVANEDERLCKPQRTQADGQRDLTGFVDDADVKLSLREQRADVNQEPKDQRWNKGSRDRFR